MKEPRCDKRYKELIVHEHTRVDPYYWLNERENSEVIDYLNSENAYTDHCMKDTASLQNEL